MNEREKEIRKIIENYRPGGSKQVAVSMDPELYAIFLRQTRIAGTTVRFVIEEGIRKWLRSQI